MEGCGRDTRFTLSSDLNITWSKSQQELVDTIGRHTNIIFKSFKRFGVSTTLAGMLASFKGAKMHISMFFPSQNSKIMFLNILAPMLGLSNIDYRIDVLDEEYFTLSMSYKLKPKKVDLVILYDANCFEYPDVYYMQIVPLLQLQNAKLLINICGTDGKETWLKNLEDLQNDQGNKIFHTVCVTVPTKACFLDKDFTEKLKQLYLTDPENAVREF